MNFILGGGITGLITAVYFKSFGILTKGGGQDKNYLGLHILRSTNIVNNFIDKYVNGEVRRGEGKAITIKLASRIYKCGFYIGNKVITRIPSKLVKEFEEKIKQNSDWVTKGEYSDIEGYDIVQVYRALVNKFDLKTRKIFLNIKKINDKEKIISGINPIHRRIKISLFYNQIINTLPVILFNSLVEGEFVRIVNSYIYVCLLESRELGEKMKDVDFVYFPERETPFFRITKVGENKFCVESEKVFIPKSDFTFACKVYKTVQIPFGKISNNVKPIDIKSAVHVGRNANSDQNLRIDKLIEMLENKEIRI